MIISLSGYRNFQKCQRKWFLDEKLAHWGEKDPFRRELYLLSQATSLDAWKGKMVDDTISSFIIPKILKKQRINLEDAFDFAKDLMKKSYYFAKEQTYRKNGITKTGTPEYNVLYVFEYPDEGIMLKEKLHQIWNEIQIALTNFFANLELLANLKSAQYLVSQRALTYDKLGFTIKGVPDLIAFYKNKPPHIIDWKVHTFGTKTYNQQLLLYALALYRTKPHRDFPLEYRKFEPADYQLTEYQLLSDSQRDYSITEDDVEELENYLADAIHTMKQHDCHKKPKELDIEDFDYTSTAENCKTCSLKKICINKWQ